MEQDRTRADAIAEGSIQIPVNDAMGFVYDSKTAEEIVFTYEIRPEHCNSAGGIHGGTLAAFADSVLGGAAALHLPPERYPALAEMKISIFRPASAGMKLTGTGRILKAGRRVLFAEAEIRDPDGTLIAKASGTEIPADVPS